MVGRNNTLYFKSSCASTECELREMEREKKSERKDLLGGKDGKMIVCSRQRQTDERKMVDGE